MEASPVIVHPITGEILPDDLAALEQTERQVDRYLRRQSQHYAFRRALRERIAELRGPAALPPRRMQSPKQSRVDDCPRCDGRPTTASVALLCALLALARPGAAVLSFPAS